VESAEAMQKLLERFKECPRVINVFKTIGGYNLIALVVAEDLRYNRQNIHRESLLLSNWA
jgi:DNA-binding Lrp family transcriptional regulator